MSDRGVIITNSGKKVPELIANASTFKDKTTAIYGPSKTGKTVITKHIMKLLQGHIEQILIVSPSEPSNRSYEGFVDAPFVHYRLYLPDPDSKRENAKAGALRFLETIWARQEMMAAIYTRVNSFATLSGLYARVPEKLKREGDHHIAQIAANKGIVVNKLNKKFADDSSKRDEKVREVNDKCEKMKVLILKKYISMAYKTIAASEDLEDDEVYTLHYLNFNPRLLLIFDDCAAQLKPLFNAESFRKFFYQNRHSFITLIISCQDDTDLPPNLRKNAFVSFFTEEIVFKTNFDRSKSSKNTKEYVAEIAAEVFQNHRKIAYIREDDMKQHFYYVCFPVQKPFRFGSKALHELCDKVINNGTNMDTDNPFYSTFKITK